MLEICSERGPARGFVGQSLRQSKSHGDCDAHDREGEDNRRVKTPLNTLDHGCRAAFKRVHHGIAVDDTASAAFEVCGVTNCPVTQYQRPRP